MATENKQLRRYAIQLERRWMFDVDTNHSWPEIVIPAAIIESVATAERCDRHRLHSAIERWVAGHAELLEAYGLRVPISIREDGRMTIG